MIISHKHKFIFIKTRKTAGTSIEIALSAICGNDDVITPINEEDEIIRKKVANKSFQNINIPYSKYSFKDWLRLIKYRKRLTFYNHITASTLQKYVDNEVWQSYYKFCFERDPVTKSISHYKWIGKKKSYENFETYLLSQDVLLIKGDLFYNDRMGKCLVDKVYKMEEMEAAFRDISTKINVDVLRSPTYITKKSKVDAALAPEIIKQKYKKILSKTFKAEYKDLYNL